MSLLKKKIVDSDNLKHRATAEQAEMLAEQLSDKPYGREKQLADLQQETVRTSISLPKTLLETLEDLTRHNKRRGIGPKTVSAIVRESLEKHLLFSAINKE